MWITYLKLAVIDCRIYTYLVGRECAGVLHLLDGRELREKDSSFGGGVVHLAILQHQRGKASMKYGSLENYSM